MRLRLAAGLVVATNMTVGAVPPAVPFLPPELIDSLPKPDPSLTDPAKLAERIKSNTKTAADKLAERDPGSAVRLAQAQALRDIDELLKQAENQPPPPTGGDGAPPPPAGGDSGGQPPPSGGGKPPPTGGAGEPPSDGKRPGGQSSAGGQSQPKSKGGQPMPQGGRPIPGEGQPMQVGNGDQPVPTGDQPAGASLDSGGSKSRPAMPLDDPIAKQVWGHLPDTVRKQMSQYYQEQFMPRYGGLLREYFTALAEREKGPSVRGPKR